MSNILTKTESSWKLIPYQTPRRALIRNDPPLYEGPYTIKETKADNIYVLDMGASKRLDEAQVSELRKYREPRRRLKPK